MLGRSAQACGYVHMLLPTPAWPQTYGHLIEPFRGLAAHAAATSSHVSGHHYAHCGQPPQLPLHRYLHNHQQHQRSPLTHQQQHQSRQEVSQQQQQSSRAVVDVRGLDRIHIKGARFYGYIGVLPEENRLGQPFEADITLYLDALRAGRTDELEHTVSYVDVFKTVEDVVQSRQPHRLLEAAAHSACGEVLRQHPAIQAVGLHLRKSCIPAVTAAVASVGVEVLRGRCHYPEQQQQQ